MIKKFFPFFIVLLFITSASFGQKEQLHKEDTVTAPTVDLQDTTSNPFPVVVSKITIEGNKITKDRIILRELFFKLKDTIPAGELKEKLVRSRQNLLNTSLFNFVTVTHVYDEENIEIKIFVIERWYTWPVPLFELAETNFNTWWLKKDFGRTYYGIYVVRENFRGLKESLKFKMQFGYAQQFALQYNVPYVNKKQTVGLGITTSYSRNKEIAYRTINNKRVFYHDYGKYVRDEFYTSLLLTLRKDIYNTHAFQLKYNHVSIEDTLTVLSDDYFTNNWKKSQFIVGGYEFKYDKRDFKAYPLSGYFIEAEVVKIGSGLLPQEPNVTYFSTSLKKFWKLSPKWFYAISSSAKYSLPGHQPYYLQKGLGYSDNVRAYEYYVIDGQNWCVGKTNIKYRLIEPRVQTFRFVNSRKVNTIHYAAYLNLFADAGYVQDKYYQNLNPLANRFLFGYGIGLDYVTYYDKTIRFEYSINRMGQSGFFINASAPL